MFQLFRRLNRRLPEPRNNKLDHIRAGHFLTAATRPSQQHDTLARIGKTI